MQVSGGSASPLPSPFPLSPSASKLSRPQPTSASRASSGRACIRYELTGARSLVRSRRRVTTVRQVLEAREAALEVRLDRARRTVAVLAEDDLGDVRVLAVLVVDHVTVDEHDHVGVLL